jgi:hypothetical protein
MKSVEIDGTTFVKDYTKKSNMPRILFWGGWAAVFTVAFVVPLLN